DQPLLPLDGRLLVLRLPLRPGRAVGVEDVEHGFRLADETFRLGLFLLDLLFLFRVAVQELLHVHVVEHGSSDQALVSMKVNVKRRISPFAGSVAVPEPLTIWMVAAAAMGGRHWMGGSTVFDACVAWALSRKVTVDPPATR